MNNFNNLITFLASSLSLILFFIPNFDINLKILIFIILVVSYLIILYIHIYRKYKKISKALNDTTQKHRALAIQFDAVQFELQNYKNSIDNLKIFIFIAANSKEKDRLDILLNSYLSIEKQLKNGGNNGK